MSTGRILRRAVTTASVALVAGCSFSVGDEEPVSDNGRGQTVAPTEVVSQAEELIGPKMPEGSTVDCPDQLTAEVGATTSCTWSIRDGRTIGMTVTVSEIKDDRAVLSFKNDDQTTPSPS